MTTQRVERRRFRRVNAGGWRPVPSVRVRPGCSATVVNVCAGGVFVETERGLPPGSVVEMQMELDARRCLVRGRVLRCAVAQLHGTGVKYRTAIAFDQHVPWLTHAHGYPIPTARTGDERDGRADATHVVL